MGIAAAEFYSANDGAKQTLSRRISPSDKQMEQQRERWDLLAQHLLVDLGNQSGLTMRHWLQGSYKFGTQVRPVRTAEEFDIDLGIYFEWSGTPEQGRLSPLQLKTLVQASLDRYKEGDAEDVVEVTQPKERCGRIRFAENFHVDVPAYHLDARRDARSLATQGNKWEKSDPKAFYKWFVAQFDDATRAKARRHIRYMKTWVGLKFNIEDRPSSVLLTVLVADAVAGLGSDQLASDDEAFNSVAISILKRLETSNVVGNPADRSENLAARLSEGQLKYFLEMLRVLKDISDRALGCSDLANASTVWSEAFEHFFPAPEADEIAKLATKSNALATIFFEPNIEVIATSTKNSNFSQKGVNKIGPLPKGCDIIFTLTNAARLPLGAVVNWTVRNEGEEAEEMNDLGHLGGDGISRKEKSAYVGRHFMDCVIKLRGQVIAIRRVPVTVQGVPVAPRNAPRRTIRWI